MILNNSRFLASVLAVAALCAAAVFPSPAPAENPEYERRLKELAEGDFDGLLKLATWCMDGDAQLKRKGRDLLEMIIARGTGATAASARHQLAVFCLTQGRTYHDAKKAWRLLSEAAAAGHESAGRRLAELVEAQGGKKKENLERGNRFLAQREYEPAIKTLEACFRMPGGVEDQSDEELLLKLAFVRFEEGAEIRRLDGKDIVSACSVCGATCYQACTKCQGSGKVKGRKGAELVTGIEGSEYKKEEVVDIECPQCKGTGGEICKKCLGMGANHEIMPEKIGKRFKLMGSCIQQLLEKKDSWEAINKTWAKVVELGLHLPAEFKVAGAKDVVKLIPPDESLADRPSLAKFWEGASLVDKHKFLVSIAAEAARFLRPLFMQKVKPRTLKEKSPYDLRADSIPFPPEIVSALPTVFDERWISVRGRILRQQRRRDGLDWDDDSFKWVMLAGSGSRIPLRCIYWTAKGHERQTILAKLKMGDDYAYLDRFVWSYKYAEIDERLSGLKKDAEVEFFGRFMNGSEIGEPALFEIWHVDKVSETKSKQEEYFPAQEPEVPPDSQGRPEFAAGRHFRKGLALLRDGAFNIQKRLKPEEEAALNEKRKSLAMSALAEFRASRELLETAAGDKDKISPFLEEQIGQVNRCIELLMKG